MSAECLNCIAQRSILVIKPEASKLSVSERNKLEKSIKEHTPCICPQRIDLQLTKEQAAEFWNNISDFPWFSDYCHVMTSGIVEVIFAKGVETASQAKKLIRFDMASEIRRISQEVGNNFTLDIIHGSDPSDIARELAILGL